MQLYSVISRPSSNVTVKGQVHLGQKNKTVESSPLTMRYKACVVGRTQQAARDDTVSIMTSQQA